MAEFQFSRPANGEQPTASPVAVPKICAKTYSQFETIKTFSLADHHVLSYAAMLAAFQQDKEKSGSPSYVPYIRRDFTEIQNDFETFRDWLQTEQDSGYEYHSLCHKPSKTIVGEFRLYIPTPPNKFLDSNEGGHITYYIHPEHRRKGLASYALIKSCSILGKREVDQIQAVIAEDNSASWRLMEKLVPLSLAQKAPRQSPSGERVYFLEPKIPGHIIWAGDGRQQRMGPNPSSFG